MLMEDGQKNISFLYMISRYFWAIIKSIGMIITITQMMQDF